jgi:HYDIN/CFA65/VesB-like, Ig-like domain/FlgD Ig-like domain
MKIFFRSVILIILILIVVNNIYSATIQCDPDAANYNTGTCSSSSKTETSEVQGYRNNDGWFKFDLTSIPTGSTINSVEFYGYVNNTNWPYWSLTPVNNDPVTVAAATLFTDINSEATSGYYLFRDEPENFATGWHNYSLGGNIVSNLQAARSQGWIAMGMVSRDDSRDYYIYFDGWNESNPPYLLVDCTIPSSVDDPASLSATVDSSSQIDLSWTQNGNSDDVLIAYNNSNVFGIPNNGTSYSAGNSIPGGGTVLYVGSSASYNHTGLSSPQTYYYSAWSVNSSEVYSSGIKDNATTPVSSYPWSQEFDATTSTPSEWSNESDDPWVFSNSTTYGASSDHTGSGNFASVDDSEPYTNPSNLLTPPLDLTTLSTPKLEFYYWIGTTTSGSTLHLDIFDGSTWTESVETYSLNNQWDLVSIIISSYSSSATKIRFRAEEQTAAYNCDICIDDVSITEGPADPVFGVDPSLHDFGTLFVGLEDSQTFTISNNGGGTLNITSISIGGTDPTQFTLDGATSGSLSSGESMQVDVIFNPTSDGAKSATLIIIDDLSDTTNNIALSGTGNDATIDSFPYTESFVVTSAPTDWANESSDPWKFAASATYGASSGYGGSGNLAYVDDSSPYENPHELVTVPFDVTGLSNPELEFYYWIGNGTTGSTLNLDIFDGTNWNNSVNTFSSNNGWIAASVMLGAYASEVTMIRFSAVEQTSTYNCDICIDNVTIQEGPADPIFSVDPDVKDFGTYNIGATNYPQVFTVRNDGGGTLTINSVILSGTDATDFDLTDSNSYPKSLSSGQSLTFQVTFDPEDTGSKSATLVITDDQSRTVNNVALSGTAVNYNSGGGEVDNGYYFFANSLASPRPTYDWIDHTSHTLVSTWTSGDSDDGYFQIPDIGFDFTFFGNTYRTNNVFVSSNGLITFGIGHSDYSGAEGASIPDSSVPNDMIAGCCMDLDDDNTGQIYYGGDSSMHVITWYKYHDYGDSAEWITFQIILRSDGLIKIQYNANESSISSTISADTILGDALIGIENSTGTAGIEYRNNSETGPIFDNGPLVVAFSTNEGALPVELSSYSAAATRDQKIVVEWITQSESNMIGYKIFRSKSDLYNVDYVSDLVAATNTSMTHTYEFIDAEAEPMITYNYWLQSYELDGFCNLWGPVSAMIFDAPPPELPIITELSGNHPNPFNPSTSINFSLNTPTFVSINIYNMKGQKIKSLVSEEMGANYHHVVWDGKDKSGKSAASGIYFYRMKAGDYDKVKKMLIQK